MRRPAAVAPGYGAMLTCILSMLMFWVPCAMAGYITVTMGLAEQCGKANVSWTGDSGPYHLLLTPTTLSSHGYNIWISSIPNGTNWYTLDINLPSGLQYLVTVWGASGITKAGTTDVLTVGNSPTNDSSCFLTDNEIYNLYTFSFNISNSNNGFPPQCSNLSISWPTSLESVISARRRDLISPDLTLPPSIAELQIPPEPIVNEDPLALVVPRSSTFGQQRYPGRHQRAVPAFESIIDAATSDFAVDDTSSSNKTSGNTTVPPTMFGIIPLGNSFSIPITYSPNVAFAGDLNESSISDTPTTYTKQGVTYLNWTIDLAKGTRFILVAGIGSEEEWASGGSSEMMTVGQGITGCVGSEQTGGGAPSITAGTTSTSAASNETGSTSGASTGNNSSAAPSTNSHWTGVIVACVFSAMATLVVVGAFWLCCRVRRRRRLAVQQGQPKPSIAASLVGRKKNNKCEVGTVNPNGSGSGSEQDTQLDLIGSTSPSAISSGVGGTADDLATPLRCGRPILAPLIHDSSVSTPVRTNGSSPTSPIGIFEHPLGIHPMRPPPFTMNNSTMTTSTDASVYASPISPIHDRSEMMGRQTSMDPLLPYSHSPTQTLTTQYPSSTENGTHISSLLYHRPPRIGPLVLHDASQLDSPLSSGSLSGRYMQQHSSMMGEEGAEELDGEGEDIAELKRDTLALLTSTGPGPSSNGMGGALCFQGLGPVGGGGTNISGGGVGTIMSTGTTISTSGAGGGGQGTGVSGRGRMSNSGRRRRTTQHQNDEETSYLVHRDAGRVVAGPNHAPGVRVLELPPRYEELDWEAEGDGPRERDRTAAPGTSGGSGSGVCLAVGTNSTSSPSSPVNDVDLDMVSRLGSASASSRGGGGTRSGPTSPIDPPTSNSGISPPILTDPPRDTHTA